MWLGGMCPLAKDSLYVVVTYEAFALARQSYVCLLVCSLRKTKVMEEMERVEAIG